MILSSSRVIPVRRSMEAKKRLILNGRTKMRDESMEERSTEDITIITLIMALLYLIVRIKVLKHRRYEYSA